VVLADVQMAQHAGSEVTVGKPELGAPLLPTTFGGRQADLAADDMDPAHVRSPLARQPVPSLKGRRDHQWGTVQGAAEEAIRETTRRQDVALVPQGDLRTREAPRQSAHDIR